MTRADGHPGGGEEVRKQKGSEGKEADWSERRNTPKGGRTVTNNVNNANNVILLFCCVCVT